MSANRKLLTEIQQVLKKIEEGVELFDDIWGKVYAAEQQALKEKYEADLKKEIKKLQRLRDQIKTWLGSPDVKDKNQLTEARKVIESKMEQFKICERDTKTKAYSREGLARESRLDPKDAEREEKRAWANDCLDRLNDIVDAVNADIEKLSSGKGKAKNKEQIEKLENKLKKNRWHIARLEQIIKLIDNEELDVGKLDSIKDNLEYYIETANDDDGALGVDDEFDIYEELQLDAISLRSSERAAASLAALDAEDSEDGKVAEEASANVSTSETVETEDLKAKKISAITPLKAIAAALPPAKLPAPIPVKAATKPAQTPATTQASAKPSSSPVSPAGKNPVAATAKHSEVMKSVPSHSLPISSVEASKPESATSWASLAQKQLGQQSKQIDSAAASAPPAVSTQVVQNQSQPLLVKSEPIEPPTVIEPEKSTQLMSDQTVLEKIPTFSSQENSTSRQLPTKANIDLMLLRFSSTYAPEALEIDRTSSYAPRNPIIAHPSFPTQPLENSQIIDKLPVDTLFLAFYYQQGSYQQYMAAKKLKQTSWRFHKKYLTWFQRHEEPKKTTDLFEEGTYVYFDYESGWCQRIKSEFKFEYSYLEDELNAP